jgi:hypothetical protein
MNIYILGFIIYINIVLFLLSENFMTTFIGMTISSIFISVYYILFGWNKITLVCMGCDPGGFWYQCARGTGEKGPICKAKRKLVAIFQNMLRRVSIIVNRIFSFIKAKLESYYTKIKPKLDKILNKINFLLSKVMVIFDISKVFKFLGAVNEKCDRKQKLFGSTRVGMNTAFFVNGFKRIPIIKNIPGIKKMTPSQITVLPDISKPISDVICLLIKIKKTISETLSCAFIFITYFFQKEYLDMASSALKYQYNLMYDLAKKIMKTILPLLDIVKLLFSWNGIKTLIDFVYHGVFSIFAHYLPGFNPMTVLIIICFFAVLPIFAFIIIWFKIQIILIKLKVWLATFLLGIN